MSNKMQIEIWSDIMCPFCYIGKRKLEEALSNFSQTAELNIEWKSYQLSPNMQTDPSKNMHEFLAVHKNISIEQAKAMNSQVTDFAKSVGLDYNFDKAIPANSFNAHRLLHLSKKHGLQNEMEENIFRAYFTEGLNIDDIPTLVSIAKATGLSENEALTVLNSDAYAEDVRKDIYEAQQIGVTGVPFFVFNNKQAISGAQDPRFILEVLDKSYKEWK